MSLFNPPSRIGRCEEEASEHLPEGLGLVRPRARRWAGSVWRRQWLFARAREAEGAVGLVGGSTHVP